MSFSNHDNAVSARLRAFTGAAALAIAITGTALVSAPAAASHESANCAVGGNLENGGTGTVGCAFGGMSGVSLAGTVDVSDPAMTVAAGFGGACGAPGVNAAGVIDLGEPSIVLAGGAGGSFPSPAATFAGSYP